MTSADQHDRLRFGLMCRGTRLPAWQAETLSRLLSVDGVRLELVIRPAASSPGNDGPFARVKRLVASETALWDAFNNGYVARRSQALAPTDCDGLLGPAQVLEATPQRRGKYSEYFTGDDLEQIRSFDLDFILRFAYGIIRGDVLHAARYGVWSFHHGDEQEFRGSPPAFWEVATDSPVSGVLLQRLTDRLDGGIVLRKGWFRTARHSYVANTDRVHFGGADFPAQVCRDLLRGDAGYLDAPPSTTEAPIYHKPDDRTAAAVAARTVGSFAGHQARNLAMCDQWNVGLVRAPIARFLDPDFVPTVEWFGDARGRDHYLADPFPLNVDDDPRVVVAEDYDYARRTGTISRLSFHEMTKTPVDIGDERHTSYPYTFADAGDRFLTAQVGGRRDVHLLRVSGARLLAAGQIGIDEEALDPTLVQHDGRWWLFFTRPGAQSLTELQVWWADELFGTWTPHARNPVKTDVRSARSGGTPFHLDGRMYRPSQDCSRTYGGAVSIGRVDELTPDAFSETVVRVVEPDPSWPYPAGLHTLSASGDVTYLDAKRLVFNRHETRTELTARVRRLRRRGSI